MAVGLFFILLYAIGAYDYIMNMGHNAAYFTSQSYSSAKIIYFSDYAIFPLIFRTIGIISSLMASILLLFRTHWIVKLAYIGVLAQIGLNIITFGFMDRWNIFGAVQSAFDLVILILTIVFFIYSRQLTKQGVLE